MVTKNMVDPRYYLFIGDEQSWKISLKENIWGFKATGVSFGSWNKSNVGDYIAFYVTTPIKKIIGFGNIIEKFIDRKITWPDEKFVNKPIFSNRLKFEVMFLIEHWKEGINPPSNMMLNSGRKVLSKDVFEILINQAEKSWGKFFKKNLIKKDDVKNVK